MLYNRKTLNVLFFAMIALFSFGSSSNKDLQVVKKVELEKYSGTWYEIARFPSSFESSLKCVTATYTLKENGKIEVWNKGHKISDASKISEIKGSAWVADEKETAKLKVRFFWPFSADYWIIALDDNYKYAMVGHPNRKYLWILSREKKLDSEIIQNLILQAKNQGFDTEKLEFVDHDC